MYVLRHVKSDVIDSSTRISFRRNRWMDLYFSTMVGVNMNANRKSAAYPTLKKSNASIATHDAGIDEWALNGYLWDERHVLDMDAIISAQ